MMNTVPNLKNMPVGFRFRPTDEELVNHYLKLKLKHHHSPVEIIPDIDLCKVEPWDVPALSVIESDDPEWFFFSPRGYKYSNSKRCDRTTKHGFWKATGQDRSIRTRGTNKVIGFKKTLVFYEGRVSRGVKSNWVIHEYHATTFDERQRTFVLCRLMKKAEKKAEGETDAVTWEEGEPSRLMASDYATFPASLHSTSLQHSPAGIEQQASYPNSPSPSVYLRNENSIIPIPFETTGEEDDAIIPIPFETTGEEDDANAFVDSLFVDEDFYISEERGGHAFVNGFAQSESLSRVYMESSDTDVDVVSAYGNILDASVCNEHVSSREMRVSNIFKSSHGAVHGGTRDDIWGVESSSCDSTTDKPFEINCIEISSSPFTQGRWKNQYYPRPDNLVSQRTSARRSQQQRKVSRNTVSHPEDKKVLSTLAAENEQNKAQNASPRRNLESRSPQSSHVKGKSSFICWETASNQSLFPRSVYLVNVVIGILLLIVISWDVLSC